ncbi:MAG: DUF2986 domain-containing protein [endosymbiont of Galathealinum brachiosum]|uniref:DUF2986 domain-containing protein n=1 Tax=endosymbiont of Galathealinum brachiosum TaxID=2200906 RepID=A0A370DP64_9GAMM|nr:MAG: DUF2986 domain-containing protein [endosymbiont of Galathealinum brachiosum]
MNRKKKIEGLFKKRLKRARAKLDTRPKRKRYISKADRAKAEALLEEENSPNENIAEQSKAVDVDSGVSE